MEDVVEPAAKRRKTVNDDADDDEALTAQYLPIAAASAEVTIETTPPGSNHNAIRADPLEIRSVVSMEDTGLLVHVSSHGQRLSGFRLRVQSTISEFRQILEDAITVGPPWKHGKDRSKWPLVCGI